MGKQIAAFLMMSQILIGSIILPLGDFSLIQNLPQLYRSYEKVVSPDDKGLFDFIGDYLLGGKDLLGHNQHDRPFKTGDMQFQHAATFAIIVHQTTLLPQPVPVNFDRAHNDTCFSGSVSDYHPKLFRPPLV